MFVKIQVFEQAPAFPHAQHDLFFPLLDILGCPDNAREFMFGKNDDTVVVAENDVSRLNGDTAAGAIAGAL